MHRQVSLLLILLTFVCAPAQAMSIAGKILAFGSAAVAASPPVNNVPPTASGDLFNTSTLTCSPGDWGGSPYPTISYQWRKNGVDISGATSSSYTADATSATGGVDCLVTATNASGSASADSNDLAPFNPSAVGTVTGWYDFADTSSLTVSGGTISQVNDKSGNSRHGTQADVAKQPTSGAVTINALNAAGCDGSNDTLAIPIATLGANQPALTIAAVYLPNSTTTSQQIIANNNGSNGGRSHVLNQAQNFGASQVTRVTPTSGTAILHLARSPATGSNRTSRMKLNSDDELTSSSYTRASTAGTAAAICSYGTPSGWFAGRVGEIIVYQSELSNANANRIAHYLAGKWGVTYTDLP